MAANWELAAKHKRAQVFALIPKEWLVPEPPLNDQQVDVTGPYVHQFLSQDEIEITETDAAGIAQKTTTGVWKAVDVAKAFCHRAALAHQLLNCLLEIFFDAALERAQNLDDYYAKHQKPVGPLHGVPISLKDQFHVQGVETSMGYTGWIGTFQGKKDTGLEKRFESEMVKALSASGAVFYCKTSVPHSLMSGETVNNIMGYCWNPKNRHLTAGGSSGGEGALIGLRGSPLGFGTDIGGSIRIPAASNGLFGLRPSHGRLPYQGMANSMDGQNTILSVVGPLATSAASLKLATQSILSQQPWLHDPLVLELPWRDEQEAQLRQFLHPNSQNPKEKLSFGVLRSDDAVLPHPPVLRAVDTLTSTLESLGHSVVPWEPPSHAILREIGITTWLYDGGADIHNALALSGEPPVPQISGLYGTSPRDEKTATDIAATNVAKREMQKTYMEYWNGSAERTGTGRPVDAIICPVGPAAAVREGKQVYIGYTLWVNVLDYTSVVVPVTQCDKKVDRKAEGYEPKDEVERIVHESYDPDIYHGAHVSLQIVGRRLQEEKMIALADYVSKALAEKKSSQGQQDDGGLKL